MRLQRRIISGAHVVAAAYNLLFVYTPLHQWHYGFAVVQFLSMPVLVLTAAFMACGRRRHGTTASHG